MNLVFISALLLLIAENSGTKDAATAGCALLQRQPASLVEGPDPQEEPMPSGTGSRVLIKDNGYWSTQYQFNDYFCLAWVIAGILVGDLLSKWAGDTSDSATARNPVYDNAKLLAIWAVLVQHSTPDSSLLHAASATMTVFDYDYASLLSVPIFAFISGLCSQGSPTPKRLLSVFTRILMPWLLLQVSSLISGIDGPFNLDAWYLIALVCWRMLAAICWYTRPAVAFGVMMLLSGFGEYERFPFLENEMWKMIVVRTFRFLPYFAIGYICPPHLFQKLRTVQPQKKLLGIAVGGAVLCMSATPGIWEALSSDFDGMPAESEPLDYQVEFLQVGARATRGMAIIVPLLGIVLPAEENCLTWVGKHSLYPYLLHRSMLPFLSDIMLYIHQVTDSDLLELSVQLSGCVAICVILASWPVRMIFQVIVEPRWVDFVIDGVFGRPPK